MQDWPINPFDTFVIIALLLSALFAFFRGFVHEVLAVTAWIGGAAAALYGYPSLQPVFVDIVPATIPLGAEIAAGACLFLGVLLVVSIITHMISKQVQKSALNSLDRSLGFLFGLVRGAVLLIIGYVAMAWFVPPANQPDWMREARTMELIEIGVAEMAVLLPENLRGGVPGASSSRSNAAGGQSDGSGRPSATETASEPDSLSYEDLATPKPDGNVPDGDTAPSGYGNAVRDAINREINQIPATD